MDKEKREKGGKAADVSRQQQHTGNHPDEQKEKGRPYGADDFGGTRAGAENVEPKKPGPEK